MVIWSQEEIQIRSVSASSKAYEFLFLSFDLANDIFSIHSVHIWDELTREEIYYLPGHNGCVNSVVFHPKELIIASGSSDKTIFVGELSN